jgi:hypothetical protein
MITSFEADVDDTMIFSEEESEAIARHCELLDLNTTIEQAYREGLDRGMRDAGFAPVHDDRLARLAVPPGRWGATCYTRNGLVACLGGDDWQVHAQGTGHLLATLPEEVGVVARFVRKAERLAFWPLVEEIGPELRDELRALAREAVEEEAALRHAAWRRLRAWLRRHHPAGSPGDPAGSPGDPAVAPDVRPLAS